MTSLLTRLHDESGATMTEYAVMIGVIAFLAIAGATLLGSTLDSIFADTGNTLSGL